MLTLQRAVRALAYTATRAAHAAAWLTLAVVVIVVVSVAGAFAGVSEVADWPGSILLFGDRLTMTGLGELQWHLFAVLVMFGGVQALHEDAHVRVDFLATTLGRRGRLIVNIFGHLGLLIPFLVVIIDRSVPAVELAYQSAGASSDYGGLEDSYLIKSVLPLGFTLLLVSALTQVVDYAIRLIRPELDTTSEDQS